MTNYTSIRGFFVNNIYLILTILFIANIFDWVSSIYFVSVQGMNIELNPLVKFILQLPFGTYILLVAKILVCALLFSEANKLRDNISSPIGFLIVIFISIMTFVYSFVSSFQTLAMILDYLK